MSLRQLYKLAEETPLNDVSKAQAKLDACVFAAYGIKQNDDILAFLLDLNLDLAEREAKEQEIVGPGLLSSVADPHGFMTADCIDLF